MTWAVFPDTGPGEPRQLLAPTEQDTRDDETFREAVAMARTTAVAGLRVNLHPAHTNCLPVARRHRVGGRAVTRPAG
ncbi:MAG TPA: hypothetical protein HA263_03530 [Methanoregulaceae archaeon]|nr:hypothetical protein [Methanoregulaceae archaeon]